MNTLRYSLMCCVSALFGLSFVLFPAKDANAERSLSRYCMGNAPVKKIVIEAQDEKFLPDSIKANEGDCVELLIRPTGVGVHYVVLDSTSITSKGAPLVNSDGKQIGRTMDRTQSKDELTEGRFSKGDNVVLKFQANKAGTYQLQCKKQNMNLAIIVSK